MTWRTLSRFRPCMKFLSRKYAMVYISKLHCNPIRWSSPLISKVLASRVPTLAFLPYSISQASSPVEQKAFPQVIPERRWRDSDVRCVLVHGRDVFYCVRLSLPCYFGYIWRNCMIYLFWNSCCLLGFNPCLIVNPRCFACLRYE